MKRGITFFLFLVLSFQAGWAEIYGTSPTGMLELERKHPYYLFVPAEYTAEKGWPLVVLLSRTGKKAEEIAAEWADWAKKNQVLLLVGSVFPREGTIPEETDRWWLRIKKEATERYHISPSQILLLGVGNAGPYAAYLGLKYPEEFSATALFRQASPGSLDKIAKASTNPRKHIPFYVAVDPDSQNCSAAESWMAELEGKGYEVVADPLKTDEDFSAHRERMMKWFLEGTETRSIKAEKKPKQGLKGLIKTMKKNMFGKV